MSTSSVSLNSLFEDYCNGDDSVKRELEVRLRAALTVLLIGFLKNRWNASQIAKSLRAFMQKNPHIPFEETTILKKDQVRYLANMMSQRIIHNSRLSDSTDDTLEFLVGECATMC